jgi:carotenoid cleavage dioxygenase-like enzyme
VVFDIEAAQRGQSLIQWRPELGTRIGVVGLDGASVLWLDAEPYFVFHFANGFESGGRIVIDYVRHERLVLGSGYQGRLPPMLHRMTIDLASRRIADDRVADMMVEFPRANDAREATRTRFVYSPTLTDTFGQADPPSATFNAIVKSNAETGDVVRHDFGNKLVGEAVFVPRVPSSAEDDGYLAVFVFDPANQTSDFVLLDAAHVDQEPVAMVRLPQRVPQGLHGNWIANG